MAETFQVPPGIVACASWGMCRTETAFWLLEMRSFMESQGLGNVTWSHVPGALVSKARNDVMRNLLKSPAQWVAMIDLDMVGQKDALFQLITTAFAKAPQFDVLSAYCNLRGDPPLPTMDTGTGTWEVHYPGAGVVPVMRTGAAFLLVKRHVVERVPDPWFALRVPMRPLDAIQEVDTFCRTIFDNRNPLQGLSSRAWEQMVECAANHQSAQGPWVPDEVGEDSSFCDRVTAAGLQIGVDTDIVIQHLVTTVQGWQDLKKGMERGERESRLLAGMTA